MLIRVRIRRYNFAQVNEITKHLKEEKLANLPEVHPEAIIGDYQFVFDGSDAAKMLNRAHSIKQRFNCSIELEIG